MVNVIASILSLSFRITPIRAAHTGSKRLAAKKFLGTIADIRPVRNMFAWACRPSLLEREFPGLFADVRPVHNQPVVGQSLFGPTLPFTYCVEPICQFAGRLAEAAESPGQV